MNTGGSISTFLIGPGETLQLTCAGDRFYVIACPGPVYINAGNGESQFYQGTGLDAGTQFTLLQIRNPAKTQTVMQIYTGFQDFIDHRFFNNSPQIPVIVTSFVNQDQNGDQFQIIPDQTGKIVQNEADGLNYFLVQRTLLSITNASLDQNQNPVTVNLGAGSKPGEFTNILVLIGSIENEANVTTPPFTLSAPGTFFLFCPSNGRSNTFNCFIYEIYQGIPVPV